MHDTPLDTDRYVAMLPHHRVWARGATQAQAVARAAAAAGITGRVTCPQLVFRTPEGSVNAHVAADGAVAWAWPDAATAAAHTGAKAEQVAGTPGATTPPQPVKPGWEGTTQRVLQLVLEERRRQVATYGHNETIKDGTGLDTRWLLPYTTDSARDVEQLLRTDYEDFEEDAGAPTWVHLVREEVAEAFQESDPTRLAEELVQVAALCVSWVEKLQAR